MPPEAVTLAAPVNPPKQVASVLPDMEAFTGAGSVTVTFWLALQPFASVHFFMEYHTRSDNSYCHEFVSRHVFSDDY